MRWGFPPKTLVLREVCVESGVFPLTITSLVDEARDGRMR